MATKFASEARSDYETLQKAKNKLMSSVLFIEALNLFPEIVLVLDENRQILYANHEALRFLGFESVEQVLGKRPGEVFGCVCSVIEQEGCGTSEFCQHCGVVLTILSAQRGQKESMECRMTAKSACGEKAMDWRVWSIPLNLQEKLHTFFVMKDISDEKRRLMLERIFFHDVLNDAALLRCYSESAKEGIVRSGEDVLENICRFAKRLCTTIADQRDLLDAEEGSYELSLSEFSVMALLKELVDFFSKSSMCRDKHLFLDNPGPERTINSDKSLLWRALMNLMKNALEATGDNGTVTVGYRYQEDKNHFYVHSAAVMTPEVRRQLFQRSFSTKGVGRGLGTYSVRLFAEKYLRGKAYVESEEVHGTTFFLEFPST